MNSRLSTGCSIALCLTFVGGCYQSHVAPPGETPLVDAGPIDTGVVEAGRDAGPPDARPPDAGIDAGDDWCPYDTVYAQRPVATCRDIAAPAPGVPLNLPVAFADLGCCRTPRCDVAVLAPVREVHLSTAICDRSTECDCTGEIVRPTVDCEIPGLSAGRWNVFANDAPLTTLVVDEVRTVPTEACEMLPEVDPCATPASRAEPLEPGGELPVGAGCVSQPSRDSLRVHFECVPCEALLGSCGITLVESHVDGSALWIACEGYTGQCPQECPTYCMPRDVDLLLPELFPGTAYPVWSRLWGVDEPLFVLRAGEPPFEGCLDPRAGSGGDEDGEHGGPLGP